MATGDAVECACGLMWFELGEPEADRALRLAASTVKVARELAPDAPVDDDALEAMFLAGYQCGHDDGVRGTRLEDE